MERSWKKLKSRSTLPLPWRDRSAACPFLTISISWWLKIHFALTVNSPLANSFSPAHGAGVHNSLEAARDRAWPIRVQIHWRKSKNNSSDLAAVGFTWRSKICWVATTLSQMTCTLPRTLWTLHYFFDSDFTAASRQKVKGCIEFRRAINSSVNFTVSSDHCAKGLTYQHRA